MADTKPQHTWLIDGKAYDFTNFEHPGGPVALNLGRDRDVSQLFRSYHPFSQKPEKLLAKYLIRDESTPQPNPQELFDWDRESPFFNELRTEVSKVIDLKNVKTDWARATQYAIMSVCAIVTLPAFIGGAWWALFVCPFLVWLMSVNIMHDASHFALSYNWRINHWACYLFPFISSPFTYDISPQKLTILDGITNTLSVITSTQIFQSMTLICTTEHIYGKFLSSKTNY
jgi:delta11-fatty-acid desaturase